MLPDFVRVKRRAHTLLVRWVERQVPILTPLLSEIARFRQHEGRKATILRGGDSRGELTYPASEYRFELSREDMRQLDLPQLQRKLVALAEEMGKEQSRRLFKHIGEAAAAAGNTISAGGDLRPEHLFEMLRRVHMDFDPQTGQPSSGQKWVMHPDTAAKVMPKVREWERDPLFRAEHDQILQQKREEWRDREANRKLVD